MDKRRRFGNAGEVAAARFLESKGYQILAHQFKTGFGEIDLVARVGEEWVFVEVKTRKNINFGYPEEAVNQKKLLKIMAAAAVYMEEKKIIDQPFRFDVVALLQKKDGAFEIQHLEAIDAEERK